MVLLSEKQNLSKKHFEDLQKHVKDPGFCQNLENTDIMKNPVKRKKEKRILLNNASFVKNVFKIIRMKEESGNDNHASYCSS
jgi:hypothetical protein